MEPNGRVFARRFEVGHLPRQRGFLPLANARRPGQGHRGGSKHHEGAVKLGRTHEAVLALHVEQGLGDFKNGGIGNDLEGGFAAGHVVQFKASGGEERIRCAGKVVAFVHVHEVDGPAFTEHRRHGEFRGQHWKLKFRRRGAHIGVGQRRREARREGARAWNGVGDGPRHPHGHGVVDACHNQFRDVGSGGRVSRVERFCGVFKPVDAKPRVVVGP